MRWRGGTGLASKENTKPVSAQVTGWPLMKANQTPTPGNMTGQVFNLADWHPGNSQQRQAHQQSAANKPDTLPAPSVFRFHEQRHQRDDNGTWKDAGANRHLGAFTFSATFSSRLIASGRLGVSDSPALHRSIRVRVESWRRTPISVPVPVVLGRPRDFLITRIDLAMGLMLSLNQADGKR